MDNENAISVHCMSKKFTYSLKRAMIYGLRDVVHAALMPYRFDSDGLSAHIQDAETGIGRRDHSGNIKTETGILRSSEFWALRNVSFTVKKGERIGIIGPNGAGKSTLFSILSGIYGPSEGHVETHGRLQALIALGAGFHPLLSGRENVYINAAILGFDRQWVDRNLDTILDFADIGEFIDAPVKTYSSGMLVRLGFAIAANMDPDILLIDEVLAVGDARFQSKCIGFSQRMSEKGRTVVMVSHNLQQIMRVCQRAIWLDHGRIIFDGPVDEAVRRYSGWAMCEGAESGIQHRDAGRNMVLSPCITITYEIISDERAQQLFPGALGVSRDHGDIPLPVVFRGSTLTIVVDYTLHSDIHGKLSFWVNVKDALSDVPIFGTAGWISDCLIDAVPGQSGKLVIEFPNLPLLDGHYNLYIGASDFSENGETGSLVEYAETAPSFIVVSPSGDFQLAKPVNYRLPLISMPARIRSLPDEDA